MGLVVKRLCHLVYKCSSMYASLMVEVINVGFCAITLMAMIFREMFLHWREFAVFIYITFFI